jgi:hypothetical protein
VAALAGAACGTAALDSALAHRAGIDAIVGSLGESLRLTAGTLRARPVVFMTDGAGHVAVQGEISATRPDGRSFTDTQILFFSVESGRERSVDQFIGDPPTVTAFWA